MFVLPSNFNVITDLKHIRAGVNVLVPHVGNPSRLQEHLEKTAIAASNVSNIVGVMVELTTSKVKYNDFTAQQAHNLPKRADYSFCTYGRVQALVFKSEVLKADLVYRDYVFILNCIIHQRTGKLQAPGFLDKLRDWMRYYELTFVERHDSIEFYRNEALYMTVPKRSAYKLALESQGKLHYSEKPVYNLQWPIDIPASNLSMLYSPKLQSAL